MEIKPGGFKDLVITANGLIVDKIADPTGLISKIRSRMAKDCSVRRSPFVDHIIAMRMQGVAYGRISTWLIEQDSTEHIPSGTLHRNLKKGFGSISIEIPLYEEKAAKWGGHFFIDVEREVEGAILLQRGRIDKMVRAEERIQKDKSSYRDSRLRMEMELYNEQLALLNTVRNDKIVLSREQDTVPPPISSERVILSPEAEKAMLELVLQGSISLNSGEAIDAED